ATAGAPGRWGHPGPSWAILVHPPLAATRRAVIPTAVHHRSRGERFAMRVPVVDARGVPVMPCSPPNARAGLNAGQARPKRNKLGLFYLQLRSAQEPDHQPLVVGIDPGATFEGYSVVGTQDTVCHLMLEAPTPVQQAVQIRRNMRRARRQRRWRRACRGPPPRAARPRPPPPPP